MTREEPEVRATMQALQMALRDLVEVAGLNLHQVERGLEHRREVTADPDWPRRIGAGVGEAARTAERAAAELRRLLQARRGDAPTPPTSHDWRFTCLDHKPPGPYVDLPEGRCRTRGDVALEPPRTCEHPGCPYGVDVAVPIPSWAVGGTGGAGGTGRSGVGS